MKAALLLAMFLLPLAAGAAEYFSEYESSVYTIEGSAAELVERGAGCLARQNGEITNKDVAGGTVIALINLKYATTFLLERLQVTASLLAKQGRFKVRYSNIQRLTSSGYMPVGKWFGSPWKEARDQLDGLSAAIAECMKKPTQEDW